MANPNPISKLTPDVIMAATNNGAMSDDVSKALQALLLKRLMKEEEQEEELNRQQVESRKINARLMESERMKHERAQQSCSHRKPNGESNLVGQRDYNQKTILTCQGCQKLFNPGEFIPAEIRPDPSRIGGPESAVVG